MTKSALVPRLVADDSDLVAANSRLARIATVASLFSGAIAVGILNAADAVQVLRVASLLYFAATFLAMRIPADTTQPLPEPEVERVELRVPTVRAAAAAMGVLRGATGFLVFLVAFGLKRDAEPLWFFGAVAAASVAGGFIGHDRESRAARRASDAPNHSSSSRSPSPERCRWSRRYGACASRAKSRPCSRSRSVRTSPDSRSTACCSVTRPMPHAAAPSHASRRSSS